MRNRLDLKLLDKKVPREHICLTPGEASAYLGISRSCLNRLRAIGVLPHFKFPAPWSRRQPFIFRYPLYGDDGLEKFKATFRPYARYVDAENISQFPVCWAARFLGLTEQAVRTAKWRGSIKDYRPESLRRYLIGKQLRGRKSKRAQPRDCEDSKTVFCKI